jgi:hypothetical protein
MTETKVCVECSVILPLSCFQFDKRWGKHISKCRNCINALRHSKELDPDFWTRARSMERKWRVANAERHKSNYKQWYSRNREKALARVEEWRAKNKDKARAASKKYSVKARNGLAESYVTRCLRIPLSRAPKELIEAKREHIKLIRLCRELTTSTN